MSAVVSGLARHARERPEAVAVCDLGPGGDSRRFDWRTLEAATLHLAGRLVAEAGDAPVLVSGGNRFEMLVALLAGLRAGLAVAPVAPESTAHELRELSEEIGARVAIADPETRERMDPSLRGIGLDEIDPGVRVDPGAVGDPPRGSVLLRSSGTTGPPKIVRRTAEALDAVGVGCRDRVGISEADRMLVAIPLYHSYGIDMAVLCGVLSGARLLLHPGFDAGRVRAALEQDGVTCFPAVPVMLDALARTGERRAGPAPALRRVVSAGSPLPPEVASRFAEAFGIPVGQIYGATEFGSVAYNDPDRRGGQTFRPEQVGMPFDGVELRVVSGDDPAAVLPAGEEGQVAVAAPSMLAEYLGDAGSPTRDGFLLTGDLGRLDEAGCLELTGRLKLMIDVGGLKVNPLEVEAVLARHPGVQEVVAVPIHYSETASRLKAIVVPRAGAEVTRDEMRRFARQHLIHYKVPRSFEITSEVPRSPTGKILRQQLMVDSGGAGA